MSQDNTLSISEKFFSLQGEGVTMGIPSYFIRLSNCTLACGWVRENGNWVKDKTAAWHCDSLPSWITGKDQSFEQIVKELPNFIENLHNDAHLIFTGGEPLLHQVKILSFLDWLKNEYNLKPIVEFETSATLQPFEELKNLVSYWNVSPKLSNSNMSEKRRIKPSILKWFNDRAETIFKFVISNEDDFKELNQWIDKGLISKNKLVLMPAGSSQEELKKTRPLVVNLCIKNNLRYSDRLHVVIWNEALGV